MESTFYYPRLTYLHNTLVSTKFLWVSAFLLCSIASLVLVHTSLVWFAFLMCVDLLNESN